MYRLVILNYTTGHPPFPKSIFTCWRIHRVQWSWTDSEIVTFWLFSSVSTLKPSILHIVVGIQCYEILIGWVQAKFSVECWLYGTYIGLYVAASAASSAGHWYCVPLLPPCVPVVLSHSVSFIEQVIMWDLAWATPKEGKEETAAETLDERATCVLPPNSCSPHNVVHSPMLTPTGDQWHTYC